MHATTTNIAVGEIKFVSDVVSTDIVALSTGTRSCNFVEIVVNLNHLVEALNIRFLINTFKYWEKVELLITQQQQLVVIFMQQIQF